MSIPNTGNNFGKEGKENHMLRIKCKKNSPASFESQALDRDITSENLKQHYNRVAEEYDMVMFEDNIWDGAKNITQKFVDVYKDGNQDMKILDLGCGTGILAVLLAKHGYTNIDGLDLSDKMIEKAREKNIYKNYILAEINESRLDIPTGYYDAIICCGAITSGHIKPDAMDEIVRLVKPGGKVIFTIRKNVFGNEEYYGYGQKFQDIEKKKKWRFIEKMDADYLPGSELDFQKKCHIFVYEIL